MRTGELPMIAALAIALVVAFGTTVSCLVSHEREAAPEHAAADGRGFVSAFGERTRRQPRDTNAA